MDRFYVTFGNNHINPVDGKSLYTRYVCIPAPDKAHARRIAVHRLGSKWSMIYTVDEFGGQIDRYGLTEWEWTFPDEHEGDGYE